MKHPVARKDPDRRLKLRKAILIGVTVLIAAVLALVNYLVPFSAWLSPRALPERADGAMRVTFLDVGQGDCTVVEFPSGKVLVVDAGDGSFEHSNKLVSTLKAIPKTSVSYVVTHADSDHYGGIAELIKTFGADTVYLPQTGADTTAYAKLISEAEKSGATIKTLARGDVIADESGAYTVCLSPDLEAETYIDDNDGAAVLYLSFSGVNVLLSSDIPAAREQAIYSEYVLFPDMFDSGNYRVRLEETDILKVSHHGSNNASDENWLRLLDASAAVISSGRGNGYFHPAAGAVARLCTVCENVYRTDELGDISFEILNGYYTVTTDWSNI